MNEDTGYENIRFKGLANECESSCRFVSQLVYYVNLLSRKMTLRGKINY